MHRIFSFRIFALLLHFVFTVALFWTKVDSVQVASLSTDTREAHSEVYDNLISFGIACLIIKSICLCINVSYISFSTCIHLALDVIGAFFVLWISLDGLTWQTYIVIFVFCALLPATFDIILTSLRFFIKVAGARRIPTFQLDPYFQLFRRFVAWISNS